MAKKNTRKNLLTNPTGVMEQTWLAYVAALSASFGAIAQNVAQAHIPPSEAGILCSLESVFCAIFSVLLFGEVLTVQSVVGFVLIFGAIMLAQRRGACQRHDCAQNGHEPDNTIAKPFHRFVSPEPRNASFCASLSEAFIF